MTRLFTMSGRTTRPSFMRDEAGSMTIFGLFIFVIILTVGGIAVDIMRYEYKRVTLQNTADRAVLAAGSLRQPNDPEQVVREYFRREGLEQYVTNVTVQQGLNFRRVNVETSDTSPTMFMKLLGINELTMTPASASEERYSKVEVSLVIDLSNSMNNFNRLQNLQVAGQDFIDTLFSNAEPGQISVSLVPYTGQVNIGHDLAAYFNISPTPQGAFCVDFSRASFDTIPILTTSPLTGTSHFYPWSVGRSPIPSAAPDMFFCPQHSGRRSEIVPLSGDPNFLRQRIASLMADGNTSIDIGVKWGAALLDPSFRPVVNALITSGKIRGDFAGRPLSYTDPDVLKVMVIMTDGENWYQYFMNGNYKDGLSPIYRNRSTGDLSVFHESLGQNPYYYARDGSYNRFPDGARNQNNFTGSDRLTWDEVWSLRRVQWVAMNLYANALSSNYWTRLSLADQWYNNFVTYIEPAEKDRRLNSICNAVKERDIPIFTIAFEAQPLGVQAMQNCASSPSHFFDVEGTDIRGAFRAIAGTINRLRLTQ